MSFLEATTSPGVLLALLLFVAAGIAEPVLEYVLKRRLHGNAAFDWSWDRLIAPCLRAALIVAFVICAYPALFGVHQAPGVHQLLADDTLRLNNLIGILFLCTLLCPLLPVFHQHAGLLLSLQSVIATAVVFGWFTHYLGATAASAWPGLGPAAVLLGVIVVGNQIAGMLARELGTSLDSAFDTEGLDRITLNVMELLAQAPVILVYGYALGMQIAI